MDKRDINKALADLDFGDLLFTDTDTQTTYSLLRVNTGFKCEGTEYSDAEQRLLQIESAAIECHEQPNFKLESSEVPSDDYFCSSCLLFWIGEGIAGRRGLKPVGLFRINVLAK